MRKLIFTLFMLIGTCNFLSAQVTNLIQNWAGTLTSTTGYPSTYGWTLSGTSVSLFNTANSTSGSRYIDVTSTNSPHTYNGSAFVGRVLYVRWDGSGYSSAVYSYPVTIEANKAYNFSMLASLDANGLGNKLSVGLCKKADGTGQVDGFDAYTTGTKVLTNQSYIFAATQSGKYYLTFKGSWGLFAIAQLSFSGTNLLEGNMGIAADNSGAPTAYGWAVNGITGTVFNTANGTSGSRYMDISSTTSTKITNPDGTYYTGRMFYIRWDGTAIQNGVYSYPVTLEASTTYNFSMLAALCANGQGTTISVGLSTAVDGSTNVSSTNFSTSGTSAYLSKSCTFTSTTAGKYYLTFKGSWGLFSIAKLVMEKSTVNTVTDQTLTDTLVTLSKAVNKNLILASKTDLHIISENLPLLNSKIQLNSDNAWLFFDNIKPSVVKSTLLNKIYINGVLAVDSTNMRVAVYKHGTVIIPNGNVSDTKALTVYTGLASTGTSQDLAISTYYNSLGTMNNTIRSFKLKRGYMATFANNPDGTGYSRVFIANDRDMIINLPTALDQKVSFIRAFRWEWVAKKGWAGGGTPVDLTNSSWYYDWNIAGAKTVDHDYAMMRHGRYWPGYGDINNRKNVNHLLGFNEPDQAEQANMTPDDAIAQWQELIKSGTRVGSPSPANPTNTWLSKFIAKCDSMNYRVDYVTIHCYWNSLTPQGWYDRLKGIYDAVKRPIWITEWNNGANWTGETWPTDTASQFLKQYNDIKGILQVLDTTSFVERYSLYNWVENKRAMVLGDTLTRAGSYYAADRPSFAYNPDKAFTHNWKLATPYLYYYLVNGNYTRDTIYFNDIVGEMASKYVLERKISGVDADFVAVKTFTGYTYGSTLKFGDQVYSTASYRIKVYGLDGTTYVTSRVLDIVVDAAPVAPTTLTGTPIASSINKITWNAGTNVRAYNLKRSTSATGTFTTILSNTGSLSYTDKGLSPSTNYYYVVTVLNSAGESANSAVLTVRTKDLVIPTGVVNPRIGSGDAKAALTWDFIYDAIYDIQRSATSGGTYTTIASGVDAVRYDDISLTNGTTYYYKVVPRNGAGSGTATAVMSATPKLGQHAYISFSEGTGTVAADTWGCYHARLYNAITWTTGRNSTSGAITLKKDSSSYVRLDNGIVSTLNDFTISTWTYLASDIAVNARLFDFGTGTGAYMIFIPKADASNVRFRIICSKGDNDRFIPCVLPLTQWVHIAISQSGSTFKFYVNGTLTYTDTKSTLKPSDLGVTNINYLGRSQYSSDPYCNTQYDNFAIYNYALSDAELTTLVANTTMKSITNIPTQVNSATVGIYPNPATDLVNIQSGLTIKLVELYNGMGQKVRSIEPNNSSTTLSISELSAGMYVVKVTTTTETIMKRIIKK